MPIVHIFSASNRFASYEALQAFVLPTYSEDGERMDSLLMREVGFTEYEPMSIESANQFQPEPKRPREVTKTFLYLLALLVGSAAAFSDIMPRYAPMGYMSNSGWHGIIWSSLLFLLSGVAFLKAGWKVWWGKILFLLMMIFWCDFFFREIGAQILYAMFRQSP